jgi:ribosomal protein L29
MDIEALRDYILADMIKEVETMTPEELVRELINLKAEKN